MTQPTVETTRDLGLLHRQLTRERRARRTAEEIGEQATGDLFHTVEQLRAAEAQLRRHAEEQEILNVLARELREDLDTGQILRRAVRSIGLAADVDRCLVRLAGRGGIGPIIEQWAQPSVSPLEDGLLLSTRLEQLCLDSTRTADGLWIDDVTDDPRLDAAEAAHVLETLGSCSYAGVPMWVGNHLVGWLVLHAVDHARPWTRRQRVIAGGVARDLGTALLQAQAFQEKSEAVRHLEQVNRVKSEFVSTVSHELRTPLTSITGYVELLTDDTYGALSEKQRQVLEVVARNGGRLLSLVEDLLTLSQVDAGAMRTAHAPVDLAEVVAPLREHLAPMLDGRDLVLDVAPAAAVTGLVGDVDQLRRMLMNLVTNAVKFTPDPGRVSVTTVAEPDAVELVVVDTGYGIAPEDLPRVFERFYRTSTAAELAIQGPGLGLAVVQEIVEEHRGAIDVVSTPGEGTRVTVRLPLTEVA
jgi:signal transduction histidine kinase